MEQIVIEVDDAAGKLYKGLSEDDKQQFRHEVNLMIKNVAGSGYQPKNMAAFRGILTMEEGKELQEYVKKSRAEWDRDI